jgi:hypothetical protein
MQGSPTSGMPRPSGASGLKGARFDVVGQNFTPVSVHFESKSWPITQDAPFRSAAATCTWAASP